MPLGYPMIEAGSDEHGLFILCSFELPPGGFATTVLQEVMKSPPPPIPGTVPASSDPSAALQEPDQSS
jgi:tRNA(Glu) U13 pseudouridine synthase TruD